MTAACLCLQQYRNATKVALLSQEVYMCRQKQSMCVHAKRVLCLFMVCTIRGSQWYKCKQLILQPRAQCKASWYWVRKCTCVDKSNASGCLQNGDVGLWYQQRPCGIKAAACPRAEHQNPSSHYPDLAGWSQ